MFFLSQDVVGISKMRDVSSAEVKFVHSILIILSYFFAKYGPYFVTFAESILYLPTSNELPW